MIHSCWRALATIPALAAMVAAAGCATGMPEPRPPRPPVQAETALPSYQEVAERYNERIANLPRIWARTTGRIWFPDEQGRTRTEQVEGHLQFLAPDRLLLNFDKVSQTYGLMGTNAERYWWIELDRERRAYVGDHAKVTDERIAELGMPIYPRDVIDLLGITPIPAPGESPRTSLAWTPDRRMLVVLTATGAGSEAAAPAQPISVYRRLFLDPATYEPLRVEILDADEQVRAVSVLGNYETLAIPGAGPEVPRPRIATEIYVGTADEQTTMRLRMSEPEIGRRRPNEGVFRFERLVEHYRVGEVVSLDDPRAAAR
jgi:hypothetical protein